MVGLYLIYSKKDFFFSVMSHQHRDRDDKWMFPLVSTVSIYYLYWYSKLPLKGFKSPFFYVHEVASCQNFSFMFSFLSQFDSTNYLGIYLAA